MPDGKEGGGPSDEALRVRTEVGEPDKRQEYSHKESMDGIREEAGTIDFYKERLVYHKGLLAEQEDAVENTKKQIKQMEEQLEVLMKR